MGILSICLKSLIGPLNDLRLKKLKILDNGWKLELLCKKKFKQIVQMVNDDGKFGKKLLDGHMCCKCWKQIKWMRWRLKFQKVGMWKNKCTMDGWFFEKDGKIEKNKI